MGESRKQSVPRRIGVYLDYIGAHGRGLHRGIAAYGNLVGWRFMTRPLWLFDESAIDLARWDVDGIIAAAYDPQITKQLRCRHERGVPVVNISSGIGRKELCSVTVDNEAVGRMAADYLLSRGLCHFAYQGYRTGWSVVRGQAFVARLADRGLPCHTIFVSVPGGDLRLAQEVGQDLGRWLQRLPRPVGLLVYNDDGARETLDRCHELGLRVPEDVAVMGVDNDELINQMSTPTLSSVELNLEKQGFEAAKRLDRMLQGKPTPAKEMRIVPKGVVSRGSTEVLAIGDAEVGAALRFIRENAARAIGVPDVVEAAALSRRPLEKRFRKAAGRSILAEIHRAHLERAKQLLRETDLPIPTVARASGMAGATRFGLIFRRMENSTPTAYRQQFRLGLQDIGE